jgi:hypothetical protein
MATIPIYPYNDLIVSATIMDISSAGVETPVTSGTVTAFLATSHASDATTADATLSVSAVYTGAGGVWIATIDATALTLALLDSLFASATPYLIFQKSGAVRAYAKCRYVSSRPATVS